jgi:hypothetical protein
LTVGEERGRDGCEEDEEKAHGLGFPRSMGI